MTSRDPDEDPRPHDAEPSPGDSRAPPRARVFRGETTSSVPLTPGTAWHRVRVDDEHELHLRIECRESPRVSVQALVVRGRTPPFLAAHELLPDGMRYFARAPGTRAPAEERAVRVECLHGGHLRIGVEEVWRELRVLGDGSAG